MLLKSRSHTLLQFMLLLHRKYASTIISSRPTQNCFTPTLGVNTKNIPFIHPLPFNKAQIISCCYLPFHYPKKRFGCSPKENKKERKIEQPKLSPKLPIKVGMFSRSTGFHYHHHHTSIPHLFAIHYIPLHYIPHTCTSWFDCMTWFFGSIVWIYNICSQVCMSCLPTYELHISHLVIRWERGHLTCL